MAKRLILSVLLAGVAIAAALAVWVLRDDGGGSTRAEGGTVEMGIDPEVTGNSASTLGTLEYCVRVDIPSPAFDNVSDYNVDVYVQGDTQAPVGYDAWVTYDASKVHVTAPGTDTSMKMPGAGYLGDPVPDSDGRFTASAGYLSGGPGVAGDGVLVRLGLDIGASGLVTFDLDGPTYFSLAGQDTVEHPVTPLPGLLAINEDCPPGGRPQPSPTPEEDAGPFTPYPDKPTQAAGRYRWANISIERPEGGDIYVGRGRDNPSVFRDDPSVYTHPDESWGTSIPVIKLSRLEDDGGGQIWIDASTGEVVVDSVSSDRSAFDAILATLRFEGADAPTDVWPYSDSAPRGPRREEQLEFLDGDIHQRATVTFADPEPQAGMEVFPLMGDSPTGGGTDLIVRTAYSIRAIDISGAVVDGYGHVDPRDAEAFDRFISSIKFEAR
jgi:hypothetical protein